MNRPDLIRRPASKADLINKIYKTIKNDEQLMRFLHYGYKTSDGVYLDSLDPTRPDIVGSKSHNKIAQEHILKTIKQDDIVSAKDCFLLIHTGKRRSVFENYMLVKQEILIDVLVHNDYQNNDSRLDDICDRLNYLIVHERFGLGKADISTPIPFEAPRGYYRYQLKYLFWDSKK